MSKKINVLFILPSLRFGGAERQTVDLINHLSRDIFALHLFIFEKDLDLYENLRMEGLRFHQGRRRRKYDFSLFREIATLIEKHEIDIIHGTLQIAAMFGFGGRALSAKKPGLISALHTTKNRSLKDEFFDWFLYAPLLTASDAIIMVSDDQQRKWSRKFPWLAAKMVTIHNGVDTERYAGRMSVEEIKKFKESLGINETEFTACILADLRPEKGHEYAFQALKRLREAGYPVTLLIIGDGERKKALQRLSEELFVSDRIRWLGRLKDPRPCVNAVDCLLAPSWAESFPLSVLEALAMGKPVIATSVGGVPEMISDGRNGFLVPPRNPDSIVEKMKRLMMDHVLAEKISGEARRSAVERFNLAGMVRETETLLKTVHERT